MHTQVVSMDIGKHWREICHAIQEGVFIVDPQGRIVMVNEAMTRLTGYETGELVGRPCALFGCDSCAKERARVRGAWCPLFAGKETQAKRCHIRRKDGSTLPVFKNQSLIRDQDGAVLGAVESVLDLTELDRLDRRVETLARLLDQPGSFHGMVGNSVPMRRLYDILEKAARSDAPVLLLGESGTGKELAARAIHELGGRKDAPFVQLNCAALNESLLESELFGHAKGAFTGAHRQRRGRFEAAHGGDIFLDEIGDAPLSIQMKLLRVLETKSIERVGENSPVPVDVRLIAATHQDLPSLIAQGRFRQDFYFRINVIPIELPPLRQRMEDLPLLARHFLEAIGARGGQEITGLAPEAMELLMAHGWPGNVRELRSALEYAAVLAQSGRIEARHLPPALRRAASVQEPSSSPRPIPHANVAPDAAGEAQKNALIEALRLSGGNKSQAARLLGVTRLTVLNRMRKHGVTCGHTVEG